jgi:serine/threonine protein kinase
LSTDRGSPALPDEWDPRLKDLLKRMLDKDPQKRAQVEEIRVGRDSRDALTPSGTSLDDG